MTSITGIRGLESLLQRDLKRYYPASPVNHEAVDLSMLAQELTNSVKRGESPAIELACEIVNADPQIPFGKLIKSNLTRALRQQTDKLVERDRDRIVKKTIELLGLASCPRETEDYCKLVRKLGAKAIATVTQNARARCSKSLALVANLREHGT